MNRRKWALAAAVAAIVAVGAAGVALAGEDDPPAAATSLVGRVAEKLGIGEDELASAIREAREEQIDESVANGDLSEEEAERLKERLDETPEERLLGPDGPKSDFEFRFAPEPGHDGLNGILGPAMGLLEAAEDLAAFLGISEEQLREELSEDGATLATVAEEHGRSREELKAFLEAQVHETLDELVENGVVGEERAGEIREWLSEHLDDFIDSEMPPFLGRILRGLEEFEVPGGFEFRFDWHDGGRSERERLSQP